MDYKINEIRSASEKLLYTLVTFNKVKFVVDEGIWLRIRDRDDYFCDYNEECPLVKFNEPYTIEDILDKSLSEIKDVIIFNMAKFRKIK